MNCKCNKFYIGLIIGIILPLLTTYAIYHARYNGPMEYFNFLGALFNMHAFTKLLSLSVLPNLLMFLIAIKLERLLAAKGMVTATMLYAVVVLTLRFI